MQSLICQTLRHKVNRRRVWNDGFNYRTSCERCGRPMIRTLTGWELFNPAIHADAMRKPHPRSGNAY